MGKVGIISHLYPKDLLEPSGFSFWSILQESWEHSSPSFRVFLLFEAPCKGVSKPSASQPHPPFPGMLSSTFPAATGNQTKPAEDYGVHPSQGSPRVPSKSGENWQEKLTHRISWNALMTLSFRWQQRNLWLWKPPRATEDNLRTQWLLSWKKFQNSFKKTTLMHLLTLQNPVAPQPHRPGSSGKQTKV